MADKTQRDVTTPWQAKPGRPEPLRHKRWLYIGIDVGSTSSDLVVLDAAGKTLLSDYQRTKGRPIEKAHQQLRRALSQVDPSQVVLAAATGSAGRLLARILGIPFVNEVPAQAAAVAYIYPQFRQATIIEMGGQDSKL
ncbi:MAG: hypothetical protein JSW23_03455, partial [Planctomycetota bacterium]